MAVGAPAWRARATALPRAPSLFLILGLVGGYSRLPLLAAFAIARRSHTPCSLKDAGESGSGYSRCVFLFGRFAPSRCAESRKIDYRRNTSLYHGFCVVSSLPLLDHRDEVFIYLGLPPAELV